MADWRRYLADCIQPVQPQQLSFQLAAFGNVLGNGNTADNWSRGCLHRTVSNRTGGAAAVGCFMTSSLPCSPRRARASGKSAAATASPVPDCQSLIPSRWAWSLERVTLPVVSAIQQSNGKRSISESSSACCAVAAVPSGLLATVSSGLNKTSAAAISPPSSYKGMALTETRNWRPSACAISIAVSFVAWPKSNARLTGICSAGKGAPSGVRACTADRCSSRLQPV